VLAVACATAQAATMYSTKDSYMGSGKFWGPGAIEETTIFGVVIPGIGFSAKGSFVTPFVNNGPAAPTICGELELGGTPKGTLSDGVTRINEGVNTCSFELNGVRMMAVIIDGGPHNGRQIATTLDDGNMIMTMDFALDMGIGKSGIMRMPFYGTTDEVTIPYSLQTQLGIEGGVDRAGALASGTKLRGRLGDFNNDGVLDGAIVVAGVLPLESIFMPGAPYALIRYFDTDIPYDGKLLGRLPGERSAPGAEPLPLTITPPGSASGAPAAGAQASAGGGR
jgi:hypothetical protein